MSDYLVELGKSPRARRFVQSLGLPIPMPVALKRGKGPYEARPLAGQKLVIGSAAGPLHGTIASTLVAEGASIRAYAGATGGELKEAAEAFGGPIGTISEGADRRSDALLFDASRIETPEGLRPLYEFVHTWSPGLSSSGRIVVIGAPAREAADAGGAAARMALTGFIRSLSKEVGRKGITANLVLLARGAEARGAAVTSFLLSRRSAFITGQPILVTNEASGQACALGVRPLGGKTALVTGAARGIGEATARRLAEEGAHVLCLDRPGEEVALGKLSREIGGSPLLVDISRPDSAETLAVAIDKEKARLDVVVHNAGITRDKTIAKMTTEHWDSVIDVNTLAILRMTAPEFDGLLRDGAHIIALSSIAGIAGNVGQTNYAASKAAVIGIVSSLAARLAKRGITVNAVAPGFIETRMTAAIPFAIREGARRMSSLGQGGLPVDVAEAIAFLATPASLGITGQVLRVCGGSMVGA